MEGNGEDAGDVGAEALRRASVLRPLVQAYLSRTGSLESGIRDAVWELGVSKTLSGVGSDGLQRKAGAPARWFPANAADRRELSWCRSRSKLSSTNI